VLIAEIGNNHFGCYDTALELIHAAHLAGADVIKMQAFRAHDIKHGSMPPAFYEACEFSIDQYLSMIEFTRDLGNDLFFSLFSPGMEQIEQAQHWHKWSAWHSTTKGVDLRLDEPNRIISIPDKMIEGLPMFKQAEVLYVSPYLIDQPNLSNIALLMLTQGRQVGYSDHTIGIHHAVTAVRHYGAHIVEKHFTLEKNLEWKGHLFRDTVHAADPEELNELATIMHGETHDALPDLRH
jgi:N,N'-diacetyllegionaminate synthase